MIFKVEIDMSDFYTEEDGPTFKESIKEFIVHQLKHKILAEFYAKIGDEVKKDVVYAIDLVKSTEIKREILDHMKNLKVVKRYSSKELVTVSEFITDEFTRLNSVSSETNNVVKKHIEDISKTFQKELKERYDFAFAAQIVQKLHEGGMLKEGVANLLLTDKAM